MISKVLKGSLFNISKITGPTQKSKNMYLAWEMESKPLYLFFRNKICLIFVNLKLVPKEKHLSFL